MSRTDEWASVQSDRAGEYLAGTHLQHVKRLLAGELEQWARAWRPTPAGGLWFHLEVNPMDGSSVLRAGSHPEWLTRTLLRSRDLEGDNPSINWAIPNRQGSHVAVHLSERGDDEGVIRIIDVASGEFLPQVVGEAFVAPAVWDPDGLGLHCVVSGEVSAAGTRRLEHHSIATASIAVVPPSRVWRSSYDVPQWGSDGSLLVTSTRGQTFVPTAIRRKGNLQWEPLVDDGESNFVGELSGDAFICVTNNHADRGRVISIPLATAGDHSTWTELVPQSDAVLRGVTVVGDHLVTLEIVDAAHRLRVFNLDGSFDHVVSLPPESSLDPTFGVGQANGEPRVLRVSNTRISFSLSTFAQAPWPHRYDVISRELSTARPAPPPLEGVVAQRRVATSADGVHVDYWEVRRPHKAPSTGPSPALVFAYGGFNVAVNTPVYPAPLIPFLNAGGVLLLPQLRGGGEQGLSHWLNATGVSKQRTFDDLYAVVEDARQHGTVDPERVGLIGVSNGGLLAAVATTQRPELWRAVVIAAALTDMSAIDWAVRGHQMESEFGDPSDPLVSDAMLAYSPAQHVREGSSYPSVLIDCGESDVRCPPASSYHFAERLIAAQANHDRPILLRIRRGEGHRPVPGEAWPVWLAFLMHEIGLALDEER